MAVAKLNEKSMIKIINNTIGGVSFRDFNDRKHLLPKPKSFKNVELGIIEAFYNDDANFLEQGYIVFEDVRVYDYLGIPEEIYKKILPLDSIEKFLEQDAEVIKEELADMPKAVKENVAMVAKGKKMDSRKKTKAIKDATGFDVEAEEE
jgi:hypothetical protein